MLTPCQRTCRVQSEMCITCKRTLKEIMEWKAMANEERMQIMQELKSRTTPTTHSCPECKGDAYCAMEDGKSANLCWCMSVAIVNVNRYNDTCLCKNCLAKEGRC